MGVGKAEMTGAKFHDALREDGTYRTIYRKWFGSDQHASGEHN
ncbi:hypothetical protein MHPYR_380043 [uncultured Mycobacterium sp.]|uniref:Uncharacterized protein n=1 Tax=uncultured Mycobacterium sp. TaxID=171292 RepID=A0A1Y5PDW0_9MYCO|nr:hypothetical protein MHPYR_380043 [uncultured Mycobacterium sp.]